MRWAAIFLALLLVGCGQPVLTDNQREEMLNIAKLEGKKNAALSSRMEDLETRLFASESKNLELEIKINKLKTELEKTNEELQSIKDFSSK